VTLRSAKQFTSFPDLCAHPLPAHRGKTIGAGIFAERSFRREEIVMLLDWNRTAISEVLAWDDVEDNDRVTAIAPGWYFHPNSDHPFWFLNHSCRPNVAYRDWASYLNESVVSLFALREIRTGEEIVMDYSTMTTRDDGQEDGVPWTMRCLCGMSNCRKLLKAFVNLPSELQMEMVTRREPFSGIVPAFVVNESQDLVSKLRVSDPDLFERLQLVLKDQRSLAKYFADEEAKRLL
jgi:hypothetical protein